MLPNRLFVKVTPNARKNDILADAINESGKRQLSVKITAPPEDGKANQALLKFLAHYLCVKKNQLILVSGLTSRNKVIEIKP